MKLLRFAALPRYCLVRLLQSPVGRRRKLDGGGVYGQF
jgi:hypothetical protein